jgi:hypothetical protein
MDYTTEAEKNKCTWNQRAQERSEFIPYSFLTSKSFSPCVEVLTDSASKSIPCAERLPALTHVLKTSQPTTISDVFATNQ